MSVASSKNLLITDLPDDVLEKIMYYLSYDEIATNRIVCQRFNSTSQRILNRDSKLLLNDLEKCANDVKEILPRRESTKKAHPRYMQFDLFESVSFQMRCLMRRYSKYIENNVGCFIAGKVIDESLRLFNIAKNTHRFAESAYSRCKELREIAEMAKEHFEEKIEPIFKNIINDINSCKLNDLEENSLEVASHSNNPVSVHNSVAKVSNQSFKKIHQRIRRNKISVLCVKGQIGKIRTTLRKQTRKLNELQRQTLTLNDLKKRVECLEKELRLSKENCKKSSALEVCEKIWSHMKSLSDSHSVESLIAENCESDVSTNQQSNLEQKIDNLTLLLTNVIESSKQ